MKKGDFVFVYYSGENKRHVVRYIGDVLGLDDCVDIEFISLKITKTTYRKYIQEITDFNVAKNYLSKDVSPLTVLKLKKQVMASQTNS